MTTAKKARGGPLPALKRFVHSKHMVTLVWILGIVVVWEIFACIVAATKRTPVNVLPHLYEIIGSFFSDKKVTGKMTMIELIGTACGETLSRAGIGFLAGIAAGYILALLMNLSRVVEKIAFPYDTYSGNGSDNPFDNRRHQFRENSHCGDTDLLPGVNERAGGVQVG